MNNPQPLENFSKDRRAKSGLQGRCKKCRKMFNQNNKERACLQSKIWREANPERYKAAKLRVLWTDLTVDEIMLEYQRMMKVQNDLCAICKLPESSRHHKGKLRDLAVDHCHKTGKVRGLLCSSCNRGIGIFKENIETLKIAINYLETQ